ncbi:hypothetical protein FGG08_004697 [Glutinoglossum americanum]|uniref:Uncharacterized protein n=1 Tax=Glutinoglossum americanum TaxID=1670608 RepID=A0A9P8I1U4_9PEZI|nr:hypothetical protein FGG08_004697 [Glutinoglossum americanum]
MPTYGASLCEITASVIMHTSPLARLTLTAAARPVLKSHSYIIAVNHRRNDSTLSLNLKARCLPLTYDYLSPTPYHLLNLSLTDFLPPPSPSRNALTLDLPSIYPAQPMPLGSHLIYFPPQIPESLLLPDGTDPLQSPGAPWVRRLWAGGSVKWSPDPMRTLRLRGQRAVCMENITDVEIKAKGEAEKVFVTIERRVGEVEEGMAEDDVRCQLSGEKASVVEKRIIVFMRERTAEQAATAAGTPGKVVKQGHRNLLVHGPLQLILLLELLTRKAPGVCDVPGAMIEEIEYKNLSPLYAEEPLKICGRPTDTEGVYDLWAETPAGGYAVKATAKVRRRNMEKPNTSEP